MLTAIMDGDYCTSWCFEVCLFTLLSAVANQLLLQARLKPGPELTKKTQKRCRTALHRLRLRLCTGVRL